MAKKNAFYSLLFSSFMFIQLVFLRLGNQAGSGFLSKELSEKVYYAIQIFVILGFFLFALLRRVRSEGFRRAADLCSITVLAICALILLFIPTSSALSLVLTAAGALCLGAVGGCVYLRMAQAAHGGVRVEICLFAGCSVPVLLQYVFQLKRTVSPALAVLTAAAALTLSLSAFRAGPEEGVPSEPEKTPVSAKTVILTSLIAAGLILFPSFYNGYIHHLMISSGYAEYNVYTWPRLLWIPAYALFGAVGSLRRGRFLPVTALCAALVALLNSVLVFSDAGHVVNMCLFYVAIAASVAYYDLSFWKIAMRTRHPEIWASFGRVLDSACVILAGAARISALPVAAVVAVDIALLAATIIFMALNGDFGFSAPAVSAPVREKGSDPFAGISLRFGLTQGETRVFRELVLTEDKQTAIAERLSVKVRTVQANVTSIYRKTGASTRSGLVQLYNDAMAGEE